MSTVEIFFPSEFRQAPYKLGKVLYKNETEMKDQK